MIKILEWKNVSDKEKEILMKRAQLDMEEIKGYTAGWLKKIEKDGDEAVLEYIREFDCPDFEIMNLRVSKKDVLVAYQNISSDVLNIMKEQIRISRIFADEQMNRIEKEWMIESVPGVKTGLKVVPIDSVGLYVPAGKAPLPTVAQMLTVTANSAGVKRKVVCFPPTANNYEIIVAANEAGADEIYRVGGIAAIGALAFGTKSIKKVCKIVGPGNPYVQAAKLQVFGKVGIDMLSGPSEALIIADETANSAYLASDILARAEHGPDSAGVLITTSKEIAKKTKLEIEEQFKSLSRKEYMIKSLKKYSAIILLDKDEELVSFANEYSAEHLEIQTKDPNEIFSKIKNAGSVFLGAYAPVAVGDYASGTNHCLPTGEAVKFSSPVGVDMFLKNIEFQELTREGLRNLQPIVQTISRVEGLDAHEESIKKRFED